MSERWRNSGSHERSLPLQGDVDVKFSSARYTQIKVIQRSTKEAARRVIASRHHRHGLGSRRRRDEDIGEVFSAEGYAGRLLRWRGDAPLDLSIRIVTGHAAPVPLCGPEKTL